MKTQRSRHTFRTAQRYSSVYQQQGRMFTDSDWNELSDLVKHRLDDVLEDVIGSGTPKVRGMVVDDGGDNYHLQWGHVYVDGIVGQSVADLGKELDDPAGLLFEYDKQADFPEAPALPEEAEEGVCLYLDLWERAVTFFEDEVMRDSGLHGADTCTRTQTMVQVKWCPSEIDPGDEVINPKIGEALLTLELRQGSSVPDPCDPCSHELELQDKVGNYLFRVEVHAVSYGEDGKPEQVTLKWSSENGAEHYEVGSEPKGFKKSGWVYDFFSGADSSFVSEKHLGRHLVGDGSWEPTRSELFAVYPDVLPAGKPLVRRWDGFGVFEKVGGAWQLVADSESVDRGISLSELSAESSPGHVTAGSELGINLDAMTLALDLADNSLLAGDYWEVAVRENEHESGDTLLDQALPQGIEHHYLKLGILSGGVFTPDSGDICQRFNFPPLTDITADDVCYDNGACEMPGVETVKDALDHLCAQKDLRWHNKHLHGWGVVCGLRVYCAPRITNNDDANDEEISERRKSIRVQKGYALDCEGNDMVLNSALPFNVVDYLERLDAESENEDPYLIEGDGTVSLYIEIDTETGDPALRLEKYSETKTDIKSLFEGTLLWDFVNDCILDLVKDLKEEFDFSEVSDVDDNINTEVAVGMQRRRFVSLLHLITQFGVPTHGRYLMIPYNEHVFLRQFYEVLREKLQSNTYCAMFNGFEFPTYPFPQKERRTRTLFGKNRHTKVAVSTDEKYVLTYGGANRYINVFDAEKQELINVVEMQAGEGAEIQSVVFDQTGSRIYAAATLREDDTILSFADFGNGEIKWRKTTVICDIDIVAMAISQQEEDLLYAIGHQKGLYLLRHDVLFDDVEIESMDPAFSFFASGHIAVDEERGAIYATAHSSEGKELFLYDQFVALNIKDENSDDGFVTVSLSLDSEEILEGVDGLCLGASDGSLRFLHIATNPSSNSDLKNILTYGVEDGFIVEKQPQQLSLENSPATLAYHPGHEVLMVSLAASFRVVTIDPLGTKYVGTRIPVQIHPEEMAVTPQGDLYVLNFISNTLTYIPVDEIMVDQDFLTQLATYRRDAILAFLSLIGGLLQYLKDCFCEHLLMNCPECDDDDKVYLGVIEIRDSEVEKICNFAKRKDVHTFPKVEYWMSLIPIMPLVKKAVEKVCCLALPSFLPQYLPNIMESLSTEPLEEEAQYKSRYPAEKVSEGYVKYQRTDLQTGYQDLKLNTRTYGKLGLDSAVARFTEKPTVELSGVKSTTYINSEVAATEMEMASRGIEVNQVSPYDPKSGEQMKRFRQMPNKLPKGAKVDIFEKDGKVVYYALAEETKVSASPGSISPELAAEIAVLEKRKSELADLQTLRTDIALMEAKRAEIANTAVLKTDLQTLQEERAKMAEEMVAMKAELEVSKAERAAVADTQALTSELAMMKADFAKLQSDRKAEETKLKELQVMKSTATTDFVKLQEDMESISKMHSEIKRDIAVDRPVKDVSGVSVKVDDHLRELGIRNIGELSEADPDKLIKSGVITKNQATGIVDAAKLKVQ
ncbi:MAG: DUF6519 domain-containing protein [Akkermansiaceae bacterium]